MEKVRQKPYPAILGLPRSAHPTARILFLGPKGGPKSLLQPQSSMKRREVREVREADVAATPCPLEI